MCFKDQMLSTSRLRHGVMDNLLHLRDFFLQNSNHLSPNFCLHFLSFWSKDAVLRISEERVLSKTPCQERVKKNLFTFYNLRKTDNSYSNFRSPQVLPKLPRQVFWLRLL
jgi:hypothetical protein